MLYSLYYCDTFMSAMCIVHIKTNITTFYRLSYLLENNFFYTIQRVQVLKQYELSINDFRKKEFRKYIGSVK